MKQLMALSLALLAGGVFMAGEAVAQAYGEDVDFTYGRVVSVGREKLVLEEYDYDVDGMIEVTYSIAPDVQIVNAGSLAEIEAGDNVDVDFVADDAGRKAVFIHVNAEYPEEEPVFSEEM